MKILIQTLNFAPDVIGVPKYSGELAADLASRGHDVRVLTAPPYYPHWKIAPPYRALAYRAEAWQGCTVRRVPLYVPQRPTGLKRLAHHASYAAAGLPSVADEMVRHRPDVVLAVAPSLLAAPATALAARLAGVPCWLHIQDLEVDAAFELGLLHSAWSRTLAETVERRVYSLFHRVSTISEAMRRRLIAKGVRDERCVLLRNWVDTADIRPIDRDTLLRRELGIDPSRIVALYAGNMAAKQGLELVVEAARQVAGRRPDVLVVLCGAGPALEGLRQAAAGLDNVRFVPLQPAERLGELLGSADIHLLPQREEAADLVLPSKLTGMLASGRPILAMARPGTGLAEEMSGAGWLVDPGRADALAEALVAAAENAAERAARGAVGRALALERWDRQVIVDRFEQGLAGLAEPARSGDDRLLSSLAQMSRPVSAAAGGVMSRWMSRNRRRHQAEPARRR
jgi:colanic acid biosynthesis glycosyl transferase WcaI